MRAIDLRYLTRNSEQNFKHYFPFIVQQAQRYVAGLSECRIVEVGCATGRFVRMLVEEYEARDVIGIDIIPELVQKAEIDVPAARFLVGDITRPDSLPSEKVDVVFMNTIHSLFDDPQVWLPNVLNLTRRGGYAFVFGLFNPEPVDVAVRARYSGEKNDIPGWSLVSKSTMFQKFQELGVTGRFEDYPIPAPVARHSSDPLHSWTVNREGGEMLLINGLQLIHQFSMAIIRNTDDGAWLSSNGATA